MLKVKKDKNAIAFWWIQTCRTMEIKENTSLHTQLEVAKITIDGLKRSNDNYSNKILRMQSKASLVEACVGAVETRLPHAKGLDLRTVGFSSLDTFRGRGMPTSSLHHNAGYTVSSCKPSELGMRTRELRFLAITTFYFFILIL